ncbi:Alpha/Beta hydrolase protein [Fomitopsis serialis]|uniref:Alpha/Beta hydrolase protein n=1 Tax=Fomitopsis serialis TaxID=139415 RepID=UPI0020085D38|nr:Alpha/Beta hydrolase protein [Neoantrodia serialis]KAH9916852.1 Alpha/Beta hydrolase protein [Neoantrodia serialis]
MLTVTYSRVGSLDIKLDIEVPAHPNSGALPAVIYFHGGGMVAGSRRDALFPEWFRESVLKRGFIFVAADYRLVHPCTGFDIVEDVKMLFRFLGDESFSTRHLPDGMSLDTARIAVAGFSGGGYPARATGIYASPKPKAALLYFAQGGDMLSDQWVAVKDHPMPVYGAAVPPDPEMRAQLAGGLPPIADAPFQLRGNGSLLDPDGRWYFCPYWFRTGDFLDNLLGEPMSAGLRDLPASERLAAVPEHLRPALLEAQLDATFPPTFLVHGLADGVVLPSESQATYDRLSELGVRVELIMVPNADHILLSTANLAVLADGAAEAQEKGMDFAEHELRA